MCYVLNKMERELKESCTKDQLETYLLKEMLMCSMLISPVVCYLMNSVKRTRGQKKSPVPWRFMRPMLTIPWLRQAVAVAESVQASLQGVLDPVLGACGVLHFQSQPR